MASGVGLADSLIEGIGIAGTPNGGVVSIQGVVGGTALPSTPQGGDQGVTNVLNVTGATTSQTTSTQSKPIWATGAIFWLTTTANPGGGQNLRVVLSASTVGSTRFINFLDFGVVITAANAGVGLWTAPMTNSADLIPIAASGINITVWKEVNLPARWFATVIHSGAGAWTYTLDYTYI